MRTPVAAAAAVVAKQIIDRVEEKISSDSFWGGGFASGTDYVARDMVTKVHRGERITPAAFNPTRAERGGGSDLALLDQIKTLTEEVTMLRAETRAVVKNTGKTAAQLDRAMPDGDALATRVAA
jgi:hypothetical protein